MTDNPAKTLSLEEFDAQLAKLKELREKWEATLAELPPQAPDEPRRPGILASLFADAAARAARRKLN